MRILAPGHCLGFYRVTISTVFIARQYRSVSAAIVSSCSYINLILKTLTRTQVVAR